MWVSYNISCVASFGRLLIGVVLSGRTGIPDAETAIFPFVTTVPAQCTVVGSNDDLVKRVQDDIVKVLPYQHTPLRFIQRWLGHPDQSLFDSIFVYQKSALGEVDNTTPLWNTVEEIGYVDVSFKSLYYTVLTDIKQVFRIHRNRSQCRWLSYVSRHLQR